MRRRQKVFLCLWIICLALGGSTPSRGADWVVLPGIELKGQYDNNINNSPKNRKSDYILSARPNVSLSYNSEVTKLEGRLAVLGLHYFHNSELDNIDQNYSINGSYNATTRLGLKLAAAFITDSTAREELEASGTLINRKTRTSLSVNPGLSYLLTERLSTNFGYRFGLVDYQSRAVNNYNNYKGHLLTHGFDFLLNEKTTLLSRLTGSYYRYDSGNTIFALGPQIGFRHRYLERWGMTFLGGLNVNWIKSNVRVLSADNVFGFLTVKQQEQTSSNISPFISIGTDYRWETGGLDFNYTRDQSANAQGNQSQYNNFSLNINQSITSRLTFSLNPYFHTSIIQNPGSDYNSTYIGIRQGLSYKFTERATVGANYTFAYRTVTGSSNYAYPNNIVWLTISYSYPLHYQ